MPPKQSNESCDFAFLQGGQAARTQLADMNATPDQLWRDSPAVNTRSKKRTAAAVSSGGAPDKKRSRVINLMAYSGAAAHAAGASHNVSRFGGSSFGINGQLADGGDPRMDDGGAMATQHALTSVQEEQGMGWWL